MFVRGRAAAWGEIAWDPMSGRIDRDRLEGLDAVVNLAGAGIATSRWTAARKALIASSRVRGTALLAETLASLAAKSRVLVSASAVGYYGDRGEERLDESHSAGTGFLAATARAWEDAAAPAERAGVRVVTIRTGIVLSRRGGALAKMLVPFRLGLGGPIGSGRQGFSWIALDDVVGAIVHAIGTDGVRGPVNVVTPEPVSQRAFAAALGAALHRPAVVPLPAFAVRALFGQMGEEALLAGAFVLPRALRASGFVWRWPDLPAVLAHLLSPEVARPV